MSETLRLRLRRANLPAVTEIEYPTGRSRGDVARLVAEAGLNAIPGVGGTLAVVMTEVWTPTLERRRQEWFQQLSDDVETVAGEVADLQHLLGDDPVFDVALRATEVAVRTRSKVKHRALRAAVLNTATRRELDADRRDIFLGLVERLTEAHLVMLAFLDDVEGFARRAGVTLANIYMGGLSTHIKKVFPDWPRELYDVLVADLDSAGLSEGRAALHATMTAQGTVARRTSELGQGFIAFITHPTETGPPTAP